MQHIKNRMLRRESDTSASFFLELKKQNKKVYYIRTKLRDGTIPVSSEGGNLARRWRVPLPRLPSSEGRIYSTGFFPATCFVQKLLHSAEMAFFDRSVDFKADSTKLECFSFFDENGKQHLDEDDFKRLIASLLNQNGETLCESMMQELFVSIDSDADGKIDGNEFENLWNNFIKPLKHPVTALLVIDVQNDFIDGSLALKHCSAKQDGYEVVPIINELIGKISFDVLVYSLDYHPEDHISFYDNVKLYELSNENQKSIEDIELFDTVLFHDPPKMEQKLWPKHCISGSWGSKLHQDLKVPEDSVSIHKGTNSKIDSYSAFWDNIKSTQTELDDVLKQRKVTHVFLCGLALDHCVSATASHALELGYVTVVIDDATRGISERTIESTKEKLVSNYCVLASCSEIDDIVKGKDIRHEFAKILVKSIKNN